MEDAKNIAKNYNPAEFEDKLYNEWVEKGYFHAEVDKDKKPFTIVIPPPNVTGQLHMGHALDETLQDILIRYKRMQGYSALWIPGTDHAGIATQIKVEENLRVNEGLTRYDLGREKFLERVWNLQSIVNDEEGYSADLEKNINKAIKKVGEDFERMKFNTAIATMMSLVNDFSKKGSVTKGEYKTLITLLNPVAPHMTEELWLTYGNGELLSLQPWPKYDEGKTVDDEIEIVVQINGKIKDKLMIPAGLDKDGTQEAAMNTEKIKGLIEGKNVVKVIAVPGKLVNIVVK
mgnify:CR=1 FL=1